MSKKSSSVGAIFWLKSTCHKLSFIVNLDIRSSVPCFCNLVRAGDSQGETGQ